MLSLVWRSSKTINKECTALPASLKCSRHGHIFKHTLATPQILWKPRNLLFKSCSLCFMHSCICQFGGIWAALGKSPSYGHLSWSRWVRYNPSLWIPGCPAGRRTGRRLVRSMPWSSSLHPTSAENQGMFPTLGESLCIMDATHKIFHGTWPTFFMSTTTPCSRLISFSDTHLVLLSSMSGAWS